MKLSKNQKKILTFCAKNKCDLQGRFYTLDYLASHMKLSYEVVYQQCGSLYEKRMINWGDKQHTAFCLTGDGLDYRELARSEKLEIWINRLWGFFAGVATGLLVSWISYKVFTG